MFASEDKNDRTGSSAGSAPRAQTWGVPFVGVGRGRGWDKFLTLSEAPFLLCLRGVEIGASWAVVRGQGNADSLLHSRPRGQAQARC